MKNNMGSNNEACDMTMDQSCGNCWGHQEYNYKVSDAPRKRNSKSYLGFIRAFVQKYLP